MLTRLFSWIKSHPAATILLVVLVYLSHLFIRAFFGINLTQLNLTSPSSSTLEYYGAADSVGISNGSYMPQSRGIVLPPMGGSTNPDVAPQDRLVVTSTNLSLLVKDVKGSTSSIKKQAESVGGFMVNSSLSSPEEATTGYITVRVPTTNLDAFLDFTRSQAVRVVSENITGHDITDQYKDIDARLETLRATKTTFEGIISRATTVDEILRVQQSIFTVQDQIDALIGQQQYLENTSQTASVTLHLSTDELSLPYAPAQPWRPEVIFKTAVRSLSLTLRSVGTLIIWLTVYSVLWIPALLVIFWFTRRSKKLSRPS